MRTHQIGITLDAPTLAEVDRRAARERRSRSNFIARVIAGAVGTLPSEEPANDPTLKPAA